MAKKGKISKEKGIKVVADLLYEGKSRKEILPELAKICNASDRTVSNWIKEANLIVQERQKQDEIVRARVSEQMVEEAVKSLHITKERVLSEYAKIAFFDIKKVYKDDGTLKPIIELDDITAGAIIAVEGDKIKAGDKKAALDSICKVLGYNVTEMDTPPLVTVTGETVNINWNETKTYPKE